MERRDKTETYRKQMRDERPQRVFDSTNELMLVDNSCRLREFRTRTILREEFGKKVVRKFAMTEEAAAFLKAIVVRERENVKYLRGHFDILCGNLKGNCIEYEYVPYDSLFQKIASELRKNCCIEADELLRLYVQKVHALPKVRIHPNDFLSFVTQGRRKYDTLAYNCLSRGLLDLIPRNIMLNGDKWLLIDNEWSFDFPVPVVFVIFRAIRGLVIELQDEIRITTTKSRPAIGVFARGLKTHYMPKDWIKYIVDSHVSFAEMLKWEMDFQRHVTGSRGVPVGHIKTNPRSRILFSASHLGSSTGIVQVVIRSLKRLPIMRRLFYFFECMILRLQK